MKKGDLSKWVDLDSCRNLLFFSQLVNELLFDYSIPSNRISTLNSHYLCFDAMNSIDGIEKEGVPEGTLKPIMEELLSELIKDPVFEFEELHPTDLFIKRSESKIFKANSVKDMNYRELKTTATALFDTYFSGGWYYDTIKEQIRKTIINNDPAEQQKLFRLVKILLTELVNYGYSSRYIFDVMKQYYWTPKDPVDTPRAIDHFFDSFDFERRNYEVVFIVERNKIGKLLKFVKEVSLKKDFEARTSSHREKQFLAIKNSQAYLVMMEAALDYYQAASVARDTLIDYAALYRLFDHTYRYDISSAQCGVYLESHFFYIGDSVSPVAHIKRPSDKKIDEGMNDAFTAFETPTTKGKYRTALSYLNAVRFHSHALDSKSNENQLLDFWAIFETLLDVNNKHSSERIQQICNSLVPILKKKYCYSLFSQLAMDLRNYAPAFFDETFAKYDCSDEIIVHKVCEFVLLEDNKNQREAFLAQCNDYPLLKERIEYYNSQLGDTNKAFHFVEKHAERVKWQIMRIYRNRNLIIHNGKSMPYLPLLIENLHSYVDDFLTYYIKQARNGYDMTTIDQILFVEECKWVNGFSKKRETISSEDIEYLLSL